MHSLNSHLKQTQYQNVTKNINELSFYTPLDGARLVAVRGLMHQEVPECVNKESTTEHRS